MIMNGSASIVLKAILLRRSPACSRGVFSFLSTSLDDYKRKALDIAGSSSINDVVLRIALTLQENDKDWDNKLKLMEKDNAIELEKRRAYFLGILANLSQSEVLETFFKQVIALYKDRNALVVLAIENMESANIRNSFIENSNKAFPTMTTINTALVNSCQLRRAIWKLVGINDDVTLPSFKEILLYPVLR